MKGFKILVTNTHTHTHTQTYTNNYLKRYDLTSIKCWRWSLYYYHYLFIKHCLLGFNSQLLLLPPLVIAQFTGMTAIRK